MLLEPVITVFVATYIVIVAVGHVLLVAAILRCLREDFIGGRRRKAAADQTTPDGKMELLPAPSKGPVARRVFAVEPWRASVARNKSVLNFAEQQRALGYDLRYVATVTGSQC